MLNNAITTQTNPAEKPGPLHFFRIFKEQPNETYCETKPRFVWH